MKEEKIKVLALLPMELPKKIELDNTLEAMQNFVGGLIECITLSDTGSAVTLVCNDEGKLLGLPLNRPLWDPENCFPDWFYEKQRASVRTLPSG